MIELAHANTYYAVSTAQAITHRVAATWPWYIVRAAGFTAAGLLILLMLSGIGQVTGLTYRLLEPIKAWALHKALALALCVAIVIHVTFLFLDHYISFSIVQVLVPFASNYSNHTSLFGIALGGFSLALGILAAYGIIVLVLSSLGWIDTKKGTWRKLHYISYLVMLFVLIHAIGTGSDLKYGTFRSAWIAIGLVLVLAVISRLWRSGTLSKGR